jgi:hypothetical protein
MMATKQAAVISVKQLSQSIDRAVKLAAKRHELKPEASTLLVNWEILGRILRGFDDINVAFDFAKEVTRSAKVSGMKAEPAVLKIGRDILCGFIERASLPKKIGM